MTDRAQLIQDLLEAGKTQKQAEAMADEMIGHYGDRPAEEIANPDDTFKDEQ